MDSLIGKVALITGAGSGIGAALAKGLSRAGASVCLFGRRRKRLEATARLCEGPSLILAGDVTSTADRTLLLKTLADKWSRLDLLINNAGMGAFGEFESFDEAQWSALFEVNFFAVVHLIRQALPLMQRPKSGRKYIVNLASIGGLVAHSDKVTPYVAAKHALVGLSRGLAKDLAGSAITVKAACPHLTDTEFFDSSPGAAEMAQEVEKFRSFMDTADDVAAGIIAKLDDPGVVLFPTSKPAAAYAKMRDV